MTFMLKTYRNILVLVITLILAGLFSFFRLYNLSESFSFQNDAGRDLLTLYDWQQTWKPPLLGPQTSFIAFNQSPLYFYLFFPIFLLTHSYFTTQITVVLLYIIVFFTGVYFFRNDNKILIPLFFLFFLMSIHPQLVLQHRFVWNPSFVTVFLAASLFVFLQLQKNFSNKNVFLFTLFVALADGMSISAVPALISYSFLSVWLFGKKSWKIFFAFFITHILVFLPLLLFEIKYKFQLTHRLLSYSSFEENRASSVLENIHSAYALLLPFVAPSKIILIGLFIFCVWKIFDRYKKITDIKKISINALSFFLFFFSTLLILFAPFKLEAHYIFPSLTFFLIFIATLEPRYSALLSIFFIALWVQPLQRHDYFHTARRTVKELDTCFKQVCQELSGPLFVSNQADFHRFHTAFEFKYVMKKNGCNVRYIEREPSAANQMAVVVDKSTYTHGQTSYDELTLFGPSQEKRILSCNNDLSVHLLER